jgi:putative restriction endonuclease
MPRVDAWTHEEMILVLNLYLKLPFGKMDRRNPDVIHLANIIGRTPNAVALRLANYDGKCALTGIDLSELLVASHIIPWSENEQERLNPENGICLSSLYDKAFDKGLISFTNDKRVLFSLRLKENVGKEYYAKYFEPVADAELVTPRKYHINPHFLEWHRDCIFNK